MKMSAAVIPEVGAPFEVAEVRLEPPGENEVLIRVEASGLCASDLNAVDGKRTLVPFPAVLGHEAAGVVTECGPGVRHLSPGDPVVASIVPSCGTCRWCLIGRRNFCTTAGAAMAAGGLLDGTRRLSWDRGPLHHFLTVSSFAEYAVVPVSGVVAIPPEIPLDRAALISCAVLTGFGAVHNTADVAEGSRVAVIGCGGVGLNIVQGARIKGAAQIVAVDVSEEKLALAATFGATHTVNAAADDPVEAVRDLVGGVDYAFEALGREETIQQAWRCVDAGGELVLVGLMPGGAPLTLDSGPFVNEQSIKGCYFGSADIRTDIPRLVDLYLNGPLMLDELISNRIGLDELNAGFDLLRSGEGARNVLVFD